jgi:hypothetical protein
MFHLEERVLWYRLSKVKAHVLKQSWGTGVDTLKLGAKDALKTFIHKIFNSQNLKNYEIKIGNNTLMKEVAKVSYLFIFLILNFDTLLFSWKN